MARKKRNLTNLHGLHLGVGRDCFDGGRFDRDRSAGGAVYYQHPQHVSGGTRAYTRARENGSIELTTNTARTVVESMTLISQTS